MGVTAGADVEADSEVVVEIVELVVNTEAVLVDSEAVLADERPALVVDTEPLLDVAELVAAVPTVAVLNSSR